MGYDVSFSIRNKDYDGKAYLEDDLIELRAAPKNTVLSWCLACVGAFVGSYIGGALFIVLISWLGAYIGRCISRANGDETVYYSFRANEVSKISYVVGADNRAVFRVYTHKDPSNFVKIMCTCDTTMDCFMKATFEDIITEADY